MGKISKSKKTLALVMALVMAFTIVPFGAWGIVKASAAAGNPPANARFKKVTELKDGQAYLVICQDSKHVLAEKWGPRTNYAKPNRVDAWDFNPANSYDTETLRHVLWEYDVVDNQSRATLSHVSPDTGIDPGKRLYVDVLDAYNDSSDRTITLNPNAANCSNYITAKANGDGEFFVSYPGKAYLHSACNDDGIHGNFDAQSSETPVLFYELITDAPETMEIPVSFRDLQDDQVTVNPRGGNFYDAFGFLWDDRTIPVSNSKGHVYSTFLRLAGEGPNANQDNQYDYREGLTQEYLKDGKLKYSPYAVIYLAHAIREATFVASNDNRYRCNIEFNGADIANMIRDKYMYMYDDYDWHEAAAHGDDGVFTDKWLAFDTSGHGNWGTGIENHLFIGEGDQDGIQDMYDRLYGPANAARKAQVDAFFDNCASYDSTAADNAINAISGLTDNDKAILKDYWLTVSHADALTWDNIKNGNPRYETGTVYGVNQWYNYWLGNGFLGNHHDPVTLTYNENGASMMDTAYFLLNHYFDSTNAEGYSKPVPKEDAAQELQLKRIIKADGTTTYVYDSAFASEWGHSDKVINNTKLDYSVYTGMRNDAANFTPINGLGFAKDNDTANDNNTNYGMTMHGNGKFVYSQGENLYFDFVGDDDVFLYINNKKTKVDIGGIHGAYGTRIYLNNIAATHDLKEGEIYDFDFFYMERCPKGANLRMETNIRVLSANLIPQKSAYQSVDCELSDYIPTGAGVPMGTTIYYEFGATNRGADFGEANVDLENIKFIDDKLGVEISKDNVVLGTRHDDVAAQSMGAMYQTWNETTQEWVDDAAKSKETFTGVEDIRTYMANLKLPKDARVFVYGIPHTLTEGDKLDGDIYNNNLKVVSGVEGVAGREKLGYASSGVEVLDVNTEKTFIVDFAGNLTYTPDMLYKADEASRDVAGNAKTVVTYTEGAAQNYGDASVAADGTLTYKGNKALTGTEYIRIDEKIEYPNIKMPVGSGLDHYTTTVSKTVKLVPANNVYYDDSFGGIKYTGWGTTTDASAGLTGQGGTKVVYGNAGKEVQFGQEVHYVKGGADSAPATAEFAFTGTGYTLYMNTVGESGTISATLYAADENGNAVGTPLKRDMASVKSVTAYEGVPVVNRQGLEKGNYVVKLSVNIKNGSVAYLNGIRVYGAELDKITYADTENNAQFVELRDNLLPGAVNADGTYGSGVLYIDGSDNEASVAEYKKDGPKNEIYLANGQGIAFKLATPLAPNSKVQVSARKLTATDAKMKVNTAEVAINNTVDMFYDITANVDANGNYVIQNTGDGILAITNLKVTNVDSVEFTNMNVAAVNFALATFNAPVAPVEPEVPETPDEPETPAIPQNPFEKFFNDIKNFFEKLFGIK